MAGSAWTAFRVLRAVTSPLNALPEAPSPEPLALTQRLTRFLDSACEDPSRAVPILPFQCSLDHSDIESPYDALSYVWGSENDGTETISLGGKPFVVRRNLAVALRHLRQRDQDRVLWVDAICINQDDISERNRQVAIMSEIYEHATFVVVFLGANDGKPCSELYDFFESLALAEEHDVDWVLRKTHVPVVTDQLHMLLQQPWWSRVWVVQELAYARRDPLIVYGSRQTDARTFWRGMDLLQERLMAKAESHRRRNLHGQSSRPETERLINMRMLQMRYALLSWRTRLHSAMYDMSELLKVTRAHRATDPRDHIFALNSLMLEPFRTALAPDYNMARGEAFTRIATCLLTIQPWSDMYRFFPVGEDPQLPSWVPDFSRGLGIEVHSDYDRLWRLSPQTNLIGQLDCWVGAGLLHARGIDCGVVCTAYTVEERHCNWGEAKIPEPTDTDEKLYVALASTVWDPNQPPFITKEDIAELCRKLSRESRQQLFAIFMLKATSQPLLDTGQYWLDQIEETIWEIRQERRRRTSGEDEKRLSRLKQKAESCRWTPEQIAEDLEADDLEGTRGVAQMGKTASKLEHQAKALEGGDRVSTAQLLRTACRVGLSIFSDATGLAGVAHPSVQEGDRVVMLHGLSTLFIARETGDGSDQLVIVGRAIPFKDVSGEISKGVENGWFVEKTLCFR